MLELKKLAEYTLEATELSPLMLLLAYLLGRRGHGRLVVWGMERLTRLCLWLCGVSCGILLLQAGLTAMRGAALPRGHGETLLVSLLACALAAFFLCLVQRANRRLPDFPPALPDEDCRYDGAVIRRPMLLLVSVLLCQFVLMRAQGGWVMPSFWDKMTGNTPGGDIQTALSQLPAAGGLALLVLHAHARTPLLSGRNWDRAVRWCAAWAVLGRLVLCLDVGLGKFGLIRPSMIMDGRLLLGHAHLPAATGAPPPAGAPAAAVSDSASPCADSLPHAQAVVLLTRCPAKPQPCRGCRRQAVSPPAHERSRIDVRHRLWHRHFPVDSPGENLLSCWN